jgi:hypothetical protein
MAGGFDRVLQLKLVTDVGNINAQMTSVSGKVKGLGATIASSLKLGAIGLAADAVVELGAAIGTGIADAKAAETAMINLQTTIANTGVDAAAAQEKVAALSETALDLGFDDTDATKAFDKFLTKTGSVEESAALVEASFDTARAKGVDLAAAAGEVETIYNGSAKALKDYGLAGVSGMEAVDAAMLTSQGKAAAWAADANNQLTIVQGKAGEVFEGMGVAVNEGVAAVVPIITDTLIPALTGLWTEVQPSLQALGEALGPKLTEIFNSLKLLFDTLAPHVTNMIAIIQPAIDAWVVLFGLAMDGINLALQLVIDLLNLDFANAWLHMQDVVNLVVTALGTIVGGIAQTLLNLVPGILEAATSIGGAIFGGITGFLGGLTDAVVGALRSALQGMIDLWNTFSIPGFSFHVDGVSLPNPLHGTPLDPTGTPHIQVIAPGDFQLWPRLDFPDLKLAAGGIVTRPMTALIGEAGPEAVIPLSRAGSFLGGSGGNTYNLDVHVAPMTDPYQVGQAIVRAITAYERRDGRGWRRN